MAVTNCSASLAKNIKALNNERGMLISNATGKARNEFLEFTVREQVRLRMAYNKALKNIQNDIQKLTARGRLTPLRLTQLRKNIKTELRKLNRNIVNQVKSGMKKSVNYGVRASMEGIKDTLPTEFSVGLTSDAFTQINLEAMQFLVKFPVDGIALSERIWRHHQTAFQQIMKEITAGMVTGRSSARISRDIRQYLIDPIGTGSRAGNIKALRTRARNAVLAGEKGRAARLFASANNLEIILRTEYPVGKGIYRSAHKNAMRVARTETNRAFHEGQIQYYKRKNWVVGVKWRLSFSHPKYDICDTYATANLHGLGKGGYTKTSVPEKPHPHCFCSPKNYPLKVFTSKGWKKIQEIKIDDMLLTDKGRFRKVLSKNIYKNERDVYTVSLKVNIPDGFKSKKGYRIVKVCFTEDHPFLLFNKWKQVKDLKSGDKVITLGNKCKRCGKVIFFDYKYCSKTCISLDVTDRQWSDPRHIKKMSEFKKKHTKQLWKDGTFNYERNLSKAHDASRELIKKGKHPFQSVETIKRANSSNAKKKYGDTYIEKKIGWLLEQKGIDTIPQYIVIRDGEYKDNNGGLQQRYYKLDFALPEHKIAIECDGKYWHSGSDEEKDREEYIESKGWTVVRFDEDRIRNDLKSCSEELDRILMNHDHEYDFIESEVIEIRKWKNKPGEVISIHVDEDQTYIANGFVVHNCYTVSILDRNRLFGQKGIEPRRTNLNRGQAKGILDRKHKRLGISGKGKEDFVFSRSASSYQAITPEAKDSLSMFTDARGNLTKQRQELHDAIVAKHLRGVKSSNAPETVIMGGGPASGKSTAQRAIGLDDWHKGNRVFIDTDEIKKLLPEFSEGLRQGNAGAAAFTHLESSMISQRIVDEAVKNKFHFILDGTGDGSLEKLAGRIARYRAQDSKIIAHYVTVDTNVAVARSLARAKETGRLVPEQFIRDTHAGVSRVLPQAIERGLFDEITLWDTGGDKLLKVMNAKGKKIVVLDEKAWREFLEKAFPILESIMMERAVVVETEDLERILLEVVNGLEPAVPDTPEFAAKRRQLQIDVDEIIARGEIVDIPFELP